MKNEFLSHLLSTIDYRFNGSIIFGDKKLGDFCAGEGSRSPKEIVHHMYQVLKNTRIFIVEEKFNQDTSAILDWSSEVERFKEEIKKTVSVLANKELDNNYSKKLIQGPFSDLITHIGQISMLSRLYGKPITGEDFSKAKIKTGIK